MKINARMVTLIAIVGMLIATTLICGCTGTQNAPATEKATAVPTLTTEVTKVQTPAPVEEKVVTPPVKAEENQTNVSEKNETKAVSVEIPAVNKTDISSEVKNVTAEVKNTTVPAELAENITAGNKTGKIVETIKEKVANKTPVKNVTAALSQGASENKTAAV